MANAHDHSLGLPELPADLDPRLRGFLTAVKEMLETREGQRRNTELEKVVLIKDLVGMGLFDTKTGQFGGKKDKVPPKPPTNLAAFQRGKYNLVTWKNPTDEDLDFVEIWAAEDSSVIDDAKLKGVIKKPGETFEHNAIMQTSSYTYWARACDTSWNYSGWTTTAAMVGPGIDNNGDSLYELFFDDLSKNPGVIRIREAIQTVGAWYYEDQSYVVGNVVVFGGYVYEAIKDNPAPSKEPTDVEYWKRHDSLAGLATVHDTRIVEAEGQIQLRATKTEFNELEGVVNDQGATLDVMTDQISSKVSQTTFDVLDAKVATVSSEVLQMADSWTVRIQSLNNGQKAVTGIDLALNDGTGQSQFIVMADNFRVVRDTGGTPIGMFAVTGDGVYMNNTLYAPGGIQTSHLAARCVSADKITAGTITATELAAYCITAQKIAAGSITAAHIAAGTITADMIKTGVLDAGLILEDGLPLSKIAPGVLIDADAGEQHCGVTGTGKHIYTFSATVQGPGSLTFTTSWGASRTFSVGQNPATRVVNDTDVTVYLPETYSFGVYTYTSGYSSAAVDANGCTLLASFISGLVRK